jgi:hypothetical protein
MWFQYIPRDVEWKSPYTLRNEAELDASPEQVFAIWADIDQWPRWFSDILRGQWFTPPPHGVGAEREVVLKTLSVKERFLAWEPGRRYAFTMTACTLPLAWSIVEDYQLEPLPGGRSRLVWEVRFDLRWYFVPMSPVILAVFGRMFRNATAGLQAYVKDPARQAA